MLTSPRLYWHPQIQNPGKYTGLYCLQGVIRDDRDLEALGAEFRDAYNKQPDDSALNNGGRFAANWLIDAVNHPAALFIACMEASWHSCNVL